MKAKTWVPATDRQSVSFRLREAIEADGRSAYALGQEAEVDPGMIARFISGERGLSLATVDRLAVALGLRLVEVSRGRGRPARPAKQAPCPEPTIGQLAEARVMANDGPALGNAEVGGEPENLTKLDIGDEPETPSKAVVDGPAMLTNVNLGPVVEAAPGPCQLADSPAAPVNPFFRGLLGRSGG